MRFELGKDVEFQLDGLLNKGLEFHDNFRGGFFEFVTTGGEEVVRHNLGYKPIGYLVIYKDGVVDLHAARVTEWTNNQLFLVSSVASVTVRIFVM